MSDDDPPKWATMGAGTPDDPDDWTDDDARRARRWLRQCGREQVYRGLSGLLTAARCAGRALSEITHGARRMWRHRGDQGPDPTDQG